MGIDRHTILSVFWTSIRISWSGYILLLVVSTTNAQNYLANLTHFGIEEGLSNRDVYAVHQDQTGFIWVGTKYGLNRFDGYSFKVYTKENDGLASNQVHHILEDDVGKLWLIETELWFRPIFPRHISILDRQRNAILSIEDYFGDKLPFKVEEITSFTAGEDGNLCFGTRDYRLFTYQSQVGFQQVPMEASHRFIPLFYGPQQTIWGASYTTAQHFEALLEIDAQGRILQRHPLPSLADWMSILGIDESQKLWFTLRVDQIGDVLYQLDFTNEQIQPYEDRAGLLPKEKVQDWTSRIAFRAQDQSFWYKNSPFFFVFLPEKKKLFDFSEQLSVGINAQIQSIFFDRQGSAWVGSDFGLYRIELKSNPFTHYLSMDQKVYDGNKAYSCRGIWEDQGQLFVNTYKGRHQIDLETEKVERLPFIPYTNQRGQETMLGFFPLAIFKDDQQQMWFSDFSLIRRQLDDGIEDFRTAKQEFVLSNNIWSIYQDNRAQMWLGTEQGLAKLDPASQQIHRFAPAPEYSALSTSFVHGFIENRPDTLWLTTTTGLYRWSPTTGILNRYWSGATEDYALPHDNILHLHQDADEALWLASGGGGLIYLKLDQQGQIDSLRQFTVADGLSNNTLYAVYEDQQEHLWVSSDYGIIQFDKQRHRAKAYLPQDGVTQEEFNRISHYQAEDGRLYFGGLNGVTAFYPEDLYQISKTDKTPLVVLDYRQYDAATQGVRDYTASLLHEGKITLQPGDRFQALSFALLEYIDARQNRYRYKIKGFDEAWIHIRENTLRLSSLPYGQYELVIQGQGADGQFSKQKLQIPIVVLRPYYAQLWFKLLLLVSLLFLAFAFYQWRVKNLKERQTYLETQVQERTQTIAEQAEELRQMDRTKSRFYANISHELRTPLTLILGPLSTLLKNNKLQDKELQLLKMAQQNGTDLLGLVNEILDLTKLDAGKMTVLESPTLLYPLLTRIVAAFESLAEYQHIQFDFEYEADQNLRIDLDVDKFQKIVNNLLSNAFKFTSSGGSIQLKLSDVDHQLILSIRDTGRGIHNNDLPYIFDRFYQSQHAHTGAEGGTGIGLALCKSYASLLEAELTATSTLGRGSLFSFTFPKKISSEESDIPHPEAGSLETIPISENEVENGAVLPIPSDSLVLLVEDNRSLREYTQLILSEHYRVKALENGAEAIAYLEATGTGDQPSPDLIISDIMMPVMDGFQLLEKLKSQDVWRSIPVVMLTARAGLSDKLKALRIGVDDYLTKPFDEEELLARTRNLMQNYRARIAWQREEPASLDTPATTAIEQPHQLSKADAAWLCELENQVRDHQRDRHFKVERLAELLFLSRRQLQRRVKQCTGLSPNQYIQESRLQSARELLEQGQKSSVKSVAYSVGWSDVKYFSQQYKKRFGKLPSTYF